MFQRIPVMIANALSTCISQAAAFGLVLRKADEMDAVGQPCLDIVKIVANEDDAIRGQCQPCQGTGEDLALGTTAIGAEGIGLYRPPHLAGGQAQGGRFQEIGSGNTEFQFAVEIFEEAGRTHNG